MNTKLTIDQEAKLRRLNERLVWCHELDAVKPAWVPVQTLGKEMIEKLPTIGGSILVLSDGGLLVAVVLRLLAEGLSCDNVKFVCHTERLLKLGQDLRVDTHLVCYNHLSDWFMKADMHGKFDIVIGNPPYRAGLHLEFLELSLKSLRSNGSLIFVHPSEWLVQKKSDTTKSKRQAELRKSVMSCGRTEITFIDNPWGDEVVLQAPLTITHLMPGRGVAFEDTRVEPTYALPDVIPVPRAKQELESLDDVTLFGNPAVVSSFLKKVLSHSETWEGKPLSHSGKFFVNMMRISTGGKKPKTMQYDDGVARSITGRYSFVDDRSLMVTTEPLRAAPSAVARSRGASEGNEKVWIALPTKKEAQHCLNFLTKTKFFRALLAAVKIDQHAAGPAMFRCLPWLDWSRSWSDAELNAYFKLSKSEVQMINNVVDQITVK